MKPQIVGLMRFALNLKLPLLKLTNAQKQKSPAERSFFVEFCGAQEGTRTPTVLPPLGPEPSASTNFATWAVSNNGGALYRIKSKCQ